MKTSSFALVLSGALLMAAPALAQTAAPSRAPAQGAAAATLPDAFEGDAPAASTAPASPSIAGPAAQAPDIARSEEVLRAVIAAAQGTGFDYADFTTGLGTQIRQQEAQVIPLIKGFGAIKTVQYVRQEGEAQMFKVTFDNQVTEWLIGFDAEDKIAALLFRPAES